MLQARCQNDNHGRSVVTVRFCCSCGAVVNENIRPASCAAEKHARMRRAQHPYCMDCGERVAVSQ